MNKFFNNDIYTDPGNPYHVIYSPKVLKDGSIDLVESGVEDTDEIIQSFKESTDIRMILSRVANGETELLNEKNGIFGDFTGMPKTYAEALQLHIDANRLFNSLPVELKQKFDNDENKFFVEAGSKEWCEKLADVLPAEMRSMNNSNTEEAKVEVKE